MNALGRMMSETMADREKKLWEDREKVRWTATLTYSHGGRAYYFKLDTEELGDKAVHGINEDWLREILVSLPKLRPLADGLPRQWTLAAHRVESRSKRKF